MKNHGPVAQSFVVHDNLLDANAERRDKELNEVSLNLHIVRNEIGMPAYRASTDQTGVGERSRKPTMKRTERVKS